MKIKLIIPILFIFLITGCYDYNELNKLAIVTGMAIDKKYDELEVSLLISNSKKQTSLNSDEASTIIYTGKGETISNALKEISLTSPKKLYLGHLSAVILSDEIAKENLSSINDYLLRDPLISKNFYLILSKDTSAKEILSILSPLESFPSQTITKNITTSSDSEAFSLAVSYTDFIKNMLMTGKDPILPSITTIKNEQNNDDNDNEINKSSLKIDNIGILRNDKLIGYVSNDATRGISLIENAVNQMTSTINCKNGKITFNINSLSSKKQIKNDTIKINIKGSADLTDVSCNLNLNSVNTINKLEKEIENDIKKMVSKAIKETQNYKSDVFGFGNLIYKTNPNYYKKIRTNWHEEIYPNLNTKINVDIKLISNGSINNTVIGGYK